jgi:hypothetical protein
MHYAFRPAFSHDWHVGIFRRGAAENPGHFAHYQRLFQHDFPLLRVTGNAHPKTLKMQHDSAR